MIDEYIRLRLYGEEDSHEGEGGGRKVPPLWPYVVNIMSIPVNGAKNDG